MTFDVNAFRSALVNDGARPNLFQCIINFPASIGNIVTEQLSFMARAAQLPGSTINQVPMMYFGRELKFAGNRTFQDWTVTVINDEGFAIRNQFERWHSAINSHVANKRSLTGPSDYVADGRIIQYTKAGVTDKIYNFVGMFPIDISPIELDWGSNDTIEEFAVTFAYQWWESNTTDSAGAVTAAVPPYLTQ